MKETLEDSLVRAAAEGRRQLGQRGSLRTWVQIQCQARQLAGLIRGAGFQIREAGQLREKHIHAAFAQLTADSRGVGTRQNYARTARLVLTGAGKSMAAERLTNQALGASGRSRDGTKTAVSESTLAGVRLSLAAMKDQDRAARLAVLLDLARLAGLRQQEALLAVPSLSAWARSLQERGTLDIRFGTKGGRQRDAFIRPEARAELAAAIKRAQGLASGRRLWLAGGSLQAALRSLSGACKGAGLEGTQSFHSLRYRFAREQFTHYCAAGYDQRDAARLVSLDLGHGDGRGRYVKQVYLK